MTTVPASKPLTPRKFEGLCAGSELVSYFRSQNAGDPTTVGGWSLCRDADTEDMRIQFWGINGGGPLHHGLNISYGGKGNNSQQLFYVVQQPNSNVRSFYTWRMSK